VLHGAFSVAVGGAGDAVGRRIPLYAGLNSGFRDTLTL
jgi:hypothetical protein